MDNRGFDRGICSYSESASDKVSGIVLPQSFTDVVPCVLPKSCAEVPSHVFSFEEPIVDTSEYWLVMQKVSECIENNDDPKNVTWSAHHAETSFKSTTDPKPLLAMLPLFRHAAHTPAMIKHTVYVVKQVTQHLHVHQYVIYCSGGNLN